MTDELKNRLRSLADKYENAGFCDDDPSQFLRWYKNVADVEAASFFTAMMSFGSRTQFIPKVQQVLKTADSSCGTFSDWLKKRAFRNDFLHGKAKFYRFYDYDDMQMLFEELADILSRNKTLGAYFKNQFERNKSERKEETPLLAPLISSAFPRSKIVPKGKNSANKRVHMFLRWMCRTGSPVDVGLWPWYGAENLIIPLDVHVLQEAVKLGLLPENAPASFKTACTLTRMMEEVFPGDPARADFALFGLGVDSADS